MKPYRTGANLTGLQDLISDHVRPGMKVLEIGAFVGDSTREFLKAQTIVVSVDPWDEQMPGYFVQNGRILEAWKMNTYGYHGRAYPFIGTGADYYRAAATPDYQDRFDLVYIDAVHTFDAVKFDIENCERLLVPGGKLAGHDYCPRNFPGVCNAVNLAAHRLNLNVQTYADTSWVLVEKPPIPY